MRNQNHEFRARLETLLGSSGTATRFADATGYKRPHVSTILNGHGPVPETWVAIVELLESLPPKDWPERWRCLTDPANQVTVLQQPIM